MTDRKKLVLATMRDEGPYILEWIAFHRAIGFDDFLIYTNDCRDGTDLLLERLAQNGVLTHERNQVLRRGPQKSAYKAALAHPLYQSADWVFVADVDEFLNIKLGNGMVDDLLNHHPDAEVIPVCWRLFSNAGVTGFYDGLTLETFTDAESETQSPDAVGRFVKSLYRPGPGVKRMGSHTPRYLPEYEARVKWGAPWLAANPDANPARPKSDFGYDSAQVNHYAVRTVDAFMLKRDRGDVNLMENRFDVSYWERWCQGGTPDTSVLRHLPAVQDELAAMRADPVVAALESASRQIHQNRLDELLTDRKSRRFRQSLLDLQTDGPKGETTTAPAPVEPVGPVVHLAATAAQKAKAPKRHQNRRSMLENMPKGTRCAEIGVWNGAFSTDILEVTEPQELVLIDPWDLIADEEDATKTHQRHDDATYMRTMYENVSESLGPLPNVVVRKGFSADVLEAYPDGYFDWVYIDGNHLYDFVRRDLQLAFKKVKPGGKIAGDDFFWKRDDRMHVKEAVLDEMRAQGMTNRPTRYGQQYIISVGETA